MTTDLTAAQGKLLATIRKLTELRGYSPTIDELCRESGWASNNAASQHLKALRKKGWVDWDDNLARTLRIIKEEA
jgi:repressor LexA